MKKITIILMTLLLAGCAGSKFAQQQNANARAAFQQRYKETGNVAYRNYYLKRAKK